MIPASIQQYLRRNRVPFERIAHPRAVSAQQLAATLHTSGHRVAKTVVLRTERGLWLAVLPASEAVDTERARHILGVSSCRTASEPEFADLFPDCELGAEPPFGQLYRLPVMVDERLSQEERLIVRAGSHTEAMELRFQDFATLEWPLVASFCREPLRRQAPALEQHPGDQQAHV